MDSLLIRGGFALKGEVTVGGSKNACLPIFAAALLTEETCVIENVPNLSDLSFMAKILQHLGAEVNQIRPNTWEITAKNIIGRAPYDLVRKMRASICLLGPLVGRLRHAEISLPGGCVIGQRPIDLHLSGLTRLGCDIEIKNGYIHVDAKKIRGNNVFLGGRHGSTVTGTANLLMAAVLTPGITRIDFAACEPEIEDLCRMLTSMGAIIEGIGSHSLRVQGVDRLHGCVHRVIGDRIEAGTFIAAGLLGENSITIRGANPLHLSAFLHRFEEANIHIDSENNIYVQGHPKVLKPKEIVTLPYPGFATDLQAQMTTVMAITPGISIITERIYPNRFMHVPELERMGAQISIEGSSAIINGTSRFYGAPVMASDLRASAALVLAGLIAEGETLIQRIYHLDRGYENIDQKLRNLGAQIERLSTEPVPLEMAS
ncbi:MAG: UDP-N-acetylglucosamine 1-carboxyvinyltransferase [Verrucomicrobia bacterium]|nr:MAG: UDP-N-acetylglucosamine 1-carboxyvinyltransferase [Verrucomicrobiota bacterium]